VLVTPRPRRQLIQREDIAKATLAIIDAEGLSGLSLERIAETLGVRAPSLYHHFPAKQDILAYTISQILVDVRIPPDLPTPLTQEWLVQTCLAVRSDILRHPNAVPLLATHHFPRRLLTTAFERISARLLAFGIPAELHLMVFNAMETLLLGSVLAATAQSTDAQPYDNLEVDPLRHPVLDEATRLNKWNEEELFAQALRRFLIGTLADIDTETSRQHLSAG
jgi:TetR/AcrR family transcriptional regulator, tetracycline repressor protein